MNKVRSYFIMKSYTNFIEKQIYLKKNYKKLSIVSKQKNVLFLKKIYQQL